MCGGGGAYKNLHLRFFDTSGGSSAVRMASSNIFGTYFTWQKDDEEIKQERKSLGKEINRNTTESYIKHIKTSKRNTVSSNKSNGALLHNMCSENNGLISMHAYVKPWMR